MSEPDSTVTIRAETPADRPGIRAVIVAAFGGDAEARLVEELRAEGDVLCGLVADVASDIAGHILFSRLPIAMASGEVVAAAALAPLAVSQPWQRQGIGSALVRQGLARCQELGLAAVVVLGDPAYYTRFGFRPEIAQRIQSPWSGPHLMAIELIAGSLRDGRGVARYPTAFGRLDG